VRAAFDALKNGELVVLLKNFTGDTIAVSAVYLEGRTLPKKIRALIDFAYRDIRQADIF